MVNNYDDQTADEKKEPYTLEITPERWVLAYYCDGDGYVIEITNERYKSIDMEPEAYAILNSMMLNMALFLKTYAKLGDGVK